MKFNSVSFFAFCLLAGLPVGLLAFSSNTEAPEFSGKFMATVEPAPAFEKVAIYRSANDVLPAKASSKKKTDSKSKSAASKDKVAEPKPRADQSKAKLQVSELTTTQKSKMLALLNEGETDQLAKIRGISSTRASSIKKARPFSSIDEVILVRGIGTSTFASMIDHARSLTTRRSSGAGKSKTTSKTASSSSAKG